MPIEEGLARVVTDALDGFDVTLYDLLWQGQVLKVLIDRPGGIDLETVSSATRAVSRALDDADPIMSSYQLEVSSPGLERHLRTALHWQGARGEKVKVKTSVALDGERRFDGTVAQVDDDAAVLQTSSGEVRIRFDEVDRATTVFEWGPTPKPGGPPARRGPTTKEEAAR